ncbi:hypothetical protein HQ865_17715 [Mucilaginibacter mali]|uniref:Uncharacterized protein n=1 Tax=Mucilaginibacter mali TaxID=2740462 RepID=A0A7D4PW86_9SPHI|nr:hypothetical protein [Mucilaginibacter mali]QKJ31523.1 hypothetical protein HQ865_17715 [Mucilaginibacter mali]
MKQQDVFKKIGGIITEINEQYEYLQSVNGISNDLELELLMANAHFLSDHIEILRKLNVQAAKAQEVAAREAPVPEVKPEPLIELKPEPGPETKPEPKNTPEPQYFQPFTSEPEEAEESVAEIEEEEEAPVFEFNIDNQIEAPEEEEAPEPEPAPAPIRHELTLEDIGEDWDEDEDENDQSEVETGLAPEEVKAVKAIPATPIPEPAKPTPAPEPVIEEPVAVHPKERPKQTPEPIAEKHTQIMVAEEEIITINQRMSAQMAATRVSDQLQQPINDLKGAITLNDKLLYIRELFNGYSLAYSEALDLMNRMQSFEEAQTFLKNSYATKNNWADKQAVADKFYALLQRRYL